jgi:hypothetical protein
VIEPEARLTVGWATKIVYVYLKTRAVRKGGITSKR